MLICLVLCAAAVLPMALSERPEAQNVQPQNGRNNEITRRLAANYAAAQNQGLLRSRKYEEDRSGVVDDRVPPSLSDIYTSLESKKPYFFRSAIESSPENELFRKSSLLSSPSDQIGDDHLFRRSAIMDSIGGGHLLKRDNEFRALDPIGGGHLLKREFQPRQLDAIGGGHLLKRDALDAIGGGHLLKRYSLDAIGGGHLLKRTPYGNMKEPNLEYYEKFNEASLV